MLSTKQRLFSKSLLLDGRSQSPSFNGLIQKICFAIIFMVSVIKVIAILVITNKVLTTNQQLNMRFDSDNPIN